MLWVSTVPHIHFWLLVAPMADWDVCNMMCQGLAGVSGLKQAIVDADADMPPEGPPVASERQVVTRRADVLGSNERQGEKLDLPQKILRCSLRALYQHDMLQIFSLRSGK
jgi:hypothetical protein